MSDLIERLREVARSIDNDALILHAEYTVPEAADALEAKDAEIARLREALRDVDRCLLAGAYMRARGIARAALGD